MNDKECTKVEFIESYIKVGNSDYRWNDNHGELIRCKDCAHWIPGEIPFNPTRCRLNGIGWDSDDFCSNAKRKEMT